MASTSIKLAAIFWIGILTPLTAAAQDPGPAPVATERPSVVGRVVDLEGKPIPFVTVGLCEADEVVLAPPWDSLTKWTRSDLDGRFVLPAVPMGKYRVLPVAGIEIIGGSPRPDQLPTEFRKYADQPGTPRLPRPLPGVFPETLLTIKADGPPAEVEIKEISHYTLTVRFIDGQGNPANALPDAYPIRGTLMGEDPDWLGGFDLVPGKTDTMTARVPVGLKEIEIDNHRDNVWWTWAPGLPRVSSRGIRLKQLDGDRLEIVAQRFRSNSLEIRLRSTDGKLPDDPDLSVNFRSPFRSEGGGSPEKVGDGIYRLDEMILPGRDCQVFFAADGFQNVSTGPFRFLEEGQLGVVEITIKPGVRGRGWKVADAQRVELKTPEGQLIPQLIEPGGPDRVITCRAIDRVTGKPVADAVVKVKIERRVKEDKNDEQYDYDWSLDNDSITDADGRFTVAIPEKSIADRTPLAKTEVRITISHATYVSHWDMLDASELSRKSVADDFPEFRVVKLRPGRRITGRLVGPDGSPLVNVHIYLNHFPITRETYIPDIHPTDANGRFAFNAPIGDALKLEFRAIQSARKFHDVPAEKTDLGDIRIAPGVRVSGQVLDGQGVPVPLISVTTPAVPNPDKQPNFVETTDKDGRFRTDELPPGNYRATVGDFFYDEQGNYVRFNIRSAPGLYISTPFEVHDGQDVADLTLRPVPHVTLIARVTTSRPQPKPGENNGKPPTDEETKNDLNDLSQWIANVSIKGTYEKSEWASTSSHLNLSDDLTTFTNRVPKGLTDVRLDFGPVVQRFQLGPGMPELFGPSYRVAKLETDLPAITLKRYRETSLKMTWTMPDGKPAAAPKLEAHYVREPAMRDAGVIFDPSPLQPVFDSETAKLSVLPDEEIELTVPGSEPVRLKLSEGEKREMTFPLPVPK